LRCGRCGEAMAPRTSPDTGLGWYYCNGRGKLGKDFCDTPHVPRADIDSKVFAYFERVGLDVESTRAQVATARDERLAAVRSLIESATRAERKASEALARVRRAFYDGEIDASDWKEAKADLEPELAASTAQLERLREQERAIHDWADVRDAEAETLRKLAAIRSAIVGEVNDAEGIDAVRAALLRLFERFVVHVDGDQGRIEAIVRHDAIRTVDEDLRPILRPQALEIAPNNQHEMNVLRPSARQRLTFVLGPKQPEQGRRAHRLPRGHHGSSTNRNERSSRGGARRPVRAPSAYRRSKRRLRRPSTSPSPGKMPVRVRRPARVGRGRPRALRRALASWCAARA
jgi:hypothetical protein